MRIICIGDSLTEGYVTKNSKRYYPYSTTLKSMLGRGVDVHNVGLSGRTTHQILQHLKTISISNYDIAIVLAGTNDLLNKTNQFILQKIKSVHIYCLAQGIHDVYALSLPQIYGTRPLRETKRLRLNDRIRSWCNSKQSVKYIPFGETFLYHPESKLWAHNGYHLSVRGYKEMGRFIYHSFTRKRIP